MIETIGIMHLDGNFKRQFPDAERFSYRSRGRWLVVQRGPRYINQYQVTRFDDAGEQWLLKNERPIEGEQQELALP